ncbi:hypothetical protein Nepgr_004907 [Nepenthes gracilis]|uniref:Uncharacterized protein n=1 Tax=Nepenthes gracilis TaxID=150966 RepID=A0AAD3S254_NEPGR|nr:hypothetical protein Nepgr_004907 [Nepenthes gracilis]
MKICDKAAHEVTACEVLLHIWNLCHQSQAIVRKHKWLHWGAILFNFQIHNIGTIKTCDLYEKYTCDFPQWLARVEKHGNYTSNILSTPAMGNLVFFISDKFKEMFKYVDNGYKCINILVMI